VESDKNKLMSLFQISAILSKSAGLSIAGV
jgi:hypothetical protein